MPKPPKRAAKRSAGRAANQATQMELSVVTDGSDRKTTKTVAKKPGGKKVAAKKTAKAAAVMNAAPKGVTRKDAAKRGTAKSGAPKKTVAKKAATKTVRRAVRSVGAAVRTATLDGATAGVLDRLFEVVTLRRDADPNISHSARLLSRGTAKVAQKFGEEAVECLIEAVAGNSAKLIGESADVLYHLIVMWVDAGVHPGEIWAELQRREGTSGIAEKLGRTARPAGE